MAKLQIKFTGGMDKVAAFRYIDLYLQLLAFDVSLDSPCHIISLRKGKT